MQQLDGTGLVINLQLLICSLVHVTSVSNIPVLHAIYYGNKIRHSCYVAVVQLRLWYTTYIVRNTALINLLKSLNLL